MVMKSLIRRFKTVIFGVEKQNQCRYSVSTLSKKEVDQTLFGVIRRGIHG